MTAAAPGPTALVTSDYDPLNREIVISRTPGRIQVVTAPVWAHISLVLLAESCGHEISVDGSRITVADQVVYQVVGWDEAQACLIVHLVDDRRRT